MLLRESDLNIYQLKLERLVSNADIQWWLYKSILCRQPLSRKPFNDWYGMFRLFSNLVDEFENIVKTFVDSYGDNIDYVQYCTSGTSSAQSVQGRFNYWKNLCKGL